MVNETEKISVLNYNQNKVSVFVSPDKGYSFEASEDGEIPTVIPMTIDEIRYANNSAAFKSGFLFFDESKEEEIYELLNITNWKDILKNKDIENIILNPTYDGLNKIINIKDTSAFERVRSIYQKLIVNGNQDISVRVTQIINTRYKELLNKQVNTSIVLTKKDIPQPVNNAEVDALKAQNDALQKQMEEMQKMMEQMMAAQKATSEPAKEETKKSPGRPKKTS